MGIGLLGRIAYTAVTGLAATGMAIGGAQAVKTMHTPQPKPKPHDNPPNKDNTIQLMEKILNYTPDSDVISKPTDTETKNFLLKLGVHVDGVAAGNLSNDQIETLQRNIKEIDSHLGAFGIQKQSVADLNNLKYWFKDLGQ